MQLVIKMLVQESVASHPFPESYCEMTIFQVRRQM